MTSLHTRIARDSQLVKERLILLKRQLSWCPHQARYRTALLLQAPLEVQVRLFPAPQPPTIWWTELNRIQYCIEERTWTALRGGRWRFACAVDPSDYLPRRSVFQAAAEGDRIWQTHNTVRAIFLEGQHYRATPEYERMVRGVEKSQLKDSRGCRTISEVEQYFRRLLAAFESMGKYGYMTQPEQGNRVRDEIPLYMTKEAHLLKLGGANHRILMAEVLGIRWVPFVLRGAHPEWLMCVSRQLGLPPHRSVSKWLFANDAFHGPRPLPASTSHVSNSSGVTLRASQCRPAPTISARAWASTIMNEPDVSP